MARDDTSTCWWLLLFIPVTLLLSAYLVYSSLSTDSLAASPPRLKPSWYTLTTARGEELQNKPIVGNCFLCHAYWVPIPRSEQTSNPRFAHANILLNHGNNDRCYNCHLISDRNKYVTNDGSGIMVQRTEELCGRCHGLIYEDWKLGTHGKWTGMWKPLAEADRVTYSCTQCHDPHDPAFKYNIIAPPPVWPKKYIRSKVEDGHSDPFSNFLINEEPREIF